MGVPSRVNTSMSLVQDGPTHKLIFMYLGAEGIQYGKRDFDITEIDITQSAITEFDITDTAITESDITESAITRKGKLL